MRESLRLRSESAAATRDIGAKLGRALQSTPALPIVIALNGDLGAGKTTLISGLLQSLGYQGTVKSPTYTLIETYDLAGREFCHLDLYRLNDASELEALGFHDLLRAGTIVLIEWAERAAAAMPTADLSIRIQYVETFDTAREFLLMSGSEIGQQLVDSMLSSGYCL